MFNNMPLLAPSYLIFNKVDRTQCQLDESSCEVQGVHSSGSDPDRTRGSVKPNPSLIQPPLGLLAVRQCGASSQCVCASGGCSLPAHESTSSSWVFRKNNRWFIHSLIGNRFCPEACGCWQSRCSDMFETGCQSETGQLVKARPRTVESLQCCYYVVLGERVLPLSVLILLTCKLEFSPLKERTHCTLLCFDSQRYKSCATV